MKVPCGHKISLSVPAGQFLPWAQSNPGPAEPTNQRGFQVFWLLVQLILAIDDSVLLNVDLTSYTHMKEKIIIIGYL